MKNLWFISIFSLMFFCCGGSKSEVKSIEKQKEFDELKSLISTNEFRFEAEVMYPLETQDVANAANDILGNFGNDGSYVGLKSGYFLKIKKDSVFIKLPYVGEIQRVSSYGKNDNSGIILSSILKDYNIKINTPKDIRLKFETQDESESFDIQLKLFSNRTANVLINSSNRSIIRYRGKITPIKG